MDRDDRSDRRGLSPWLTLSIPACACAGGVTARASNEAEMLAGLRVRRIVTQRKE